MPLVRTIVSRAGREGNRFSALVLGLVESDAFQKRIKTGAAATAANRGGAASAENR
jgi:hypothetical protein